MKNEEEIILLDVRSEQEFNSPVGHIENAILIPIYDLEKRIGELGKFKDKEIIVYCHSGYRSIRGAQILVENGYSAKNMLGGMIAWNNLKKNE